MPWQHTEQTTTVHTLNPIRQSLGVTPSNWPYISDSLWWAAVASLAWSLPSRIITNMSQNLGFLQARSRRGSAEEDK